eukprot:TRINITY_DN46913_c0_g1_i1.p1 TRINITY_DN46913_c0_g1~~TRINITY_DN46913_c0_g1_i1.p1  ORF type:complete len:1421 (-),score=268.03 TRINITY_DN46913_c0_g1_i1:194-4456(-)
MSVDHTLADTTPEEVEAADELLENDRTAPDAKRRRVFAEGLLERPDVNAETLELHSEVPDHAMVQPEAVNDLDDASGDSDIGSMPMQRRAPAQPVASPWAKSCLPPPMENELEFCFKDPRSYKQGKSIHSEIRTLQGGAFRFRLLVFPMGTENTGKPEQLACFVEVVPPEGSQDVRWAFENVKYQITVVNWLDYRKSVTQGDNYSFRWDNADRGWHRGFVKASFMTVESGWLNENNELCLRASCSARRAMMHVPPNASFLNMKKYVGYVGLKNHGATCYMNCLLQTLFHIGKFREIVYSMEFPAEGMDSASQATAGISEDDGVDGLCLSGLADDRPALPLLVALQNLFYRLQTSDQPVSCKELMRSFGWDTADAFMQHDAQELNRLLCDRLEEQMKGTSMDGAIKTLFEGEYENYIECTDIEYRSTRSETFYDLQLNVRNDVGKDLTTLEESLKDFCSEEVLEDDNAYDAGAHGKQRARKGIKFKRFPPVLYIQLKRFMFDAERMDMCKINGRMDFPLELDLETMAEGGGKYFLHTVVVHSGGVSSGHYYTFIRITEGEKGTSRWLKFDDEQVTFCSEQAAVEDNYGGEDMTTWNYFNLPPEAISTRAPPKAPRIHNAYMLSYVRSDKAKEVLNPLHLFSGFEPYRRLAERCEREARQAEERRRKRIEQAMRVEVKLLFERDIINLTDFWSHERDLPCTLKLRMNREQSAEDIWREVSAKTEVPLQHVGLYLLHMRKTRQHRFKVFPFDKALKHHLAPLAAGTTAEPPQLTLLCVMSTGIDMHTWKVASQATLDYEKQHNCLMIARRTEENLLLIVKYFCPMSFKLITLGCYFCTMKDRLDQMITTDAKWMRDRLKPFVDRGEVAPVELPVKGDIASWMCFEEYEFPKEITERLLDATMEKEGLFSGDIIVWQPRPAKDSPPAARRNGATADGNHRTHDDILSFFSFREQEEADLRVLTVRDYATQKGNEVLVQICLHAATGAFCPDGIPADGTWPGPLMPDHEQAGCTMQVMMPVDARWRIETFAARVAKVLGREEDVVSKGCSLWFFENSAPTEQDEAPAYRLEVPLRRRGGIRRLAGNWLAQLTMTEQSPLRIHCSMLPAPPPGVPRRPVAVHFFNNAVREVGAAVFFVPDVEAEPDDATAGCRMEDSDSSDVHVAYVASCGRPSIDASEVLKMARHHLDMPENADLLGKLMPPAAKKGQRPGLRLVDVNRGRICAVHSDGCSSTPSQTSSVAAPYREGGTVMPAPRPAWMWPSRGENFFACPLRVEPDWDIEDSLDADASEDTKALQARQELAQLVEVFHDYDKTGPAFGHPFLLPVTSGERCDSIARRVQGKLGVSPEEINQWRLLVVDTNQRRIAAGEAHEYTCSPAVQANTVATWRDDGMACCLERTHPAAQRSRSPVANRLRVNRPLQIRGR